MRQDRSLRHSRWECKYHVVFIPKYRKKSRSAPTDGDLPPLGGARNREAILSCRFERLTFLRKPPALPEEPSLIVLVNERKDWIVHCFWVSSCIKCNAPEVVHTRRRNASLHMYRPGSHQTGATPPAIQICQSTLATQTALHLDRVTYGRENAELLFSRWRMTV